MNRCGFTIPFVERCKALYAFGYNNKDIAVILKSEFDDLEFRTIDHNLIRQLIGKNVKEFNAARDSFAEAVKAEAEAWMKNIFMMAQASEQRIAHTYAEKIIQLCDRLIRIDLSDDEAENIDSILSYIQQLQGLLSKISGTDAVRDVSVYKSKAEIKSSLLGIGFGNPNNPGIPMKQANANVVKFIE